jgi:RES domain-containing protein
VRVWRICRKPYAADPLSGRGALFTSGRWHIKGRRVVYLSSSLALAALEMLVQVNRPELPADLVALEIDVPDDTQAHRIEIRSLPEQWRDYPAPEALQQIGNEWLREGRTPLLQVPSAVIPEEDNYLLNPVHPKARMVSVIRSNDFIFDPRLAP